MHIKSFIIYAIKMEWNQHGEYILQTHFKNTIGMCNILSLFNSVQEMQS